MSIKHNCNKLKKRNRFYQEAQKIGIFYNPSPGVWLLHGPVYPIELDYCLLCGQKLDNDLELT